MSEWLDRQLWWHRVRFHGIDYGCGLFAPVMYRCKRCNLIWKQF